MANMVGVRDYLNGLGLDNSQIGYNPQSGMVQYGGQDLIKAYGDSGNQGRSLASVSDIMNAVNTKGLMPQQTQYNTSINDILGQFTNRINTPFSYDVKSDPRYKAAKEQASRNAEIGSRNAMETMNERGILNSTVTGDRVAQIEQDAQSQVTNLIPQLMADAYNQYQGQNQDLMNLLGVYTNLEGQQYQRGFNERQLSAQLANDKFYQDLKTQEFDLQKKQIDIDGALSRVNMLGYVDNETSKILGIPVGTQSAQARQTAEELKNRLKIASVEAGNRIAAIEKEYALRAQADATARAENEKENDRELRAKAIQMAADPITGAYDKNKANEIFNFLKFGTSYSPSSAGISASYDAESNSIPAGLGEYFK